jgi:hypothetical protein
MRTIPNREALSAMTHAHMQCHNNQTLRTHLNWNIDSSIKLNATHMEKHESYQLWALDKPKKLWSPSSACALFDREQPYMKTVNTHIVKLCCWDACENRRPHQVDVGEAGALFSEDFDAVIGDLPGACH